MDSATNKLIAVPDELFRVRIGPLVAAFLLISAIAHAALASPRLHAWYERNLTRGIQPARWIEYSLSSSLMMVVIAMLVGIYDIASLILIFAAQRHHDPVRLDHGAAQPDHHAAPTGPPTGSDASPGSCPGSRSRSTSSAPKDPPAFVYAIFASIFVFFNIFALNMVLQYRRAGRWRDYLYGERVYMLLSLFAKSALAWQVFAGTLQPA